MHQQVPTMSLYLKGKVRKWFFTRFKNHRAFRWEQFKVEVTKRFPEQGYYNVIADLHDLKQTGIVDEYQRKFEDLKSQVLEKEPALTENLFHLSLYWSLARGIEELCSNAQTYNIG